MKPRILFFDIETTPNVSYTWGKYDQNVIEFKREWELLSFAWKYLEFKEVSCLTRKDFKSEKELVKKLHDVLRSADFLVAHNGRSFDLKKANAKFIQYGFTGVWHKPLIDTKLEAKRSFCFNSNKLDDLGRVLKVGRKIKNVEGFQLWLDCMAGSPKAFKQMSLYNKQDVMLLEKIYKKMLPWIKESSRNLRKSDRELL